MLVDAIKCNWNAVYKGEKYENIQKDLQVNLKNSRGYSPNMIYFTHHEFV